MKKPDKKTPVEPVSGASHNTESLATSRNFFKRSSIIIVMLLIVAGAIFTGWRYYKNHPNNPIAKRFKTSSCEDAELLHEAAKGINSNQITDLKDATEKMKKIHNNDQDPNCLYVLSVFYIYSGDSQNAQTYLEKLQKSYDPKKGFNKALGNTIRIADLQNNLTALKKQQDSITQFSGFVMQKPKQ